MPFDDDDWDFHEARRQQYEYEVEIGRIDPDEEDDEPFGSEALTAAERSPSLLRGCR